MDEDPTTVEMIARAAQQNNVPAEVLCALLELEAEFMDFTVFGSKTLLSRRIAQILD